MHHGRRGVAAALPLLWALVQPAAPADLPHARRTVQHHTLQHRAVQHRGVWHRAAGRPAPVAVTVVDAVPEVGAARAPSPSPTALVLPGAAGLPAFVDLTPVFAAQRGCGPGFSPDALGVCRRHGELRVDCGLSGLDCVPLPPDPLPYGPGAAARLAY